MTPTSSYMIGVNSAPTAVGRTPQWPGDRQADKIMSFGMSLSSQQNKVGSTDGTADIVQAGAATPPLPSGQSATLSDANLLPGRQAAAGLVLLQAQMDSNLTALTVADADLSEIGPTVDAETPGDVVPAMIDRASGTTSARSYDGVLAKSNGVPDAASGRDGWGLLTVRQDDGGFARQDDASRGR